MCDLIPALVMTRMMVAMTEARNTEMNRANPEADSGRRGEAK
jgi:hypothetical protein